MSSAPAACNSSRIHGAQLSFYLEIDESHFDAGTSQTIFGAIAAAKAQP